MSVRILVTASIYADPRARRVLTEAGFEVEDAPPRAPFGQDALIQLLEDFDAVIAAPDDYTEKVFASRPRLALISRWGVGIDSIDLDAATRHGVLVTNTPGIITDSVADLAFMFILALARGLKQADDIVRGGNWQPVIGANVGKATIGIIGVGEIGTRVVRRAHGFGMQILAHDPVPRLEVAHEFGVEYVELERLLEHSDFVTLHCNATADNENMIGPEELQMMKPTAYLVNCARGALVDEQALVAALREGTIAGAGLDVFEKEPPHEDNPLFELDNCLLTPHTATMDKLTIDQVNMAVTQNTLDALQGREPKYLCNPEVWEA